MTEQLQNVALLTTISSQIGNVL